MYIIIIMIVIIFIIFASVEVNLLVVVTVFSLKASLAHSCNFVVVENVETNPTEH